MFSGPENSSVLRLLIHSYERMSSFVCLVGCGERGRRLYVFIAVYFMVSSGAVKITNRSSNKQETFLGSAHEKDIRCIYDN